MELIWKYKNFNELTVAELYAIMRLRNEIFVVEQDCVYQDADEKDLKSFHLAGWTGNDLAAYCRILPAGIAFDTPSIGRVVVNRKYRKYGFGRALMTLAIEKTLKQFLTPTITIGGQLYLKNFYESLGFATTSEIYLEDNIPHIEMQYKG